MKAKMMAYSAKRLKSCKFVIRKVTITDLDIFFNIHEIFATKHQTPVKKSFLFVTFKICILFV